MLFIFDMGGVVAGNVTTLPGMAGRLGLDSEVFLTFCGVPEGTPASAVFDRGLLADIQAGRIGSQEFWRVFRENAAKTLPPGDSVLEHAVRLTAGENLWETCFHPELMPGTVAIIETLKQKGHRVVCGTNTLDAHYEVHQRRGDYAVFDAVHASQLMGVIKPHQEFWEKILEREGVSAGAVFIDDHPANVAAAAAVGLESILFTTPEALRLRLATYIGKV